MMEWRNTESGTQCVSQDGSIWGIPYKAGNRITILVEKAVESEVKDAPKTRLFCDWRGKAARQMLKRMGYKQNQIENREFHVIVEEEVKGCCEKWSGRGECGSHYCTAFGPVAVKFVPSFCPECGKKLP
jgi:hypothetical protein